MTPLGRFLEDAEQVAATVTLLRIGVAVCLMALVIWVVWSDQ